MEIDFNFFSTKQTYYEKIYISVIIINKSLKEKKNNLNHNNYQPFIAEELNLFEMLLNWNLVQVLDFFNNLFNFIYNLIKIKKQEFYLKNFGKF